MKTKQRTMLEIIKRFFQPAFHEKKMSLKVMVPSVLGSLIGVIAIYLLKDITNGISNGLNSETMFLLFIFIGLVLINYLILILTRNWTYAVLWPVYRKFMYSKYINEYTYLDNNETEKVGTGKLIAMVDKGMHSWVDLEVRFFIEVLPSITFVLFGFVFIGFINLYYLFALVIVFIGIFVLTYLLQKKAKILRIKRRDSNIAITRRFVKILMAKFEILQNEKGNEEAEKIGKELDYNIFLNYKMRDLGIFIEIFSKIFIDGSKILLILMFGMGLGNNLINFGEFVALMSILYILDQMLDKSLGLYVEFTKIFVEVEKVWDFFDTTPKIKGYFEGDEFKHKNGEIEIKNLNFGYTKNKLVFKNFDLKILGAKVTAFVGNSGSGKSTLVKLISGYIRPNSGEILIDNQKLSKISLKSYYKNIGYLTQEPSVFDGTIMNNLTYSVNRELKDGELESILKLAKCEFIYDLEKGINTQIGERGVRLSGGQKQRLAIAKIFLKDPKIIVLDEPTSALDSFSEEQITKAMHNLFKGRTVIIIAHRLQTVKNADEIILLSDGTIKERGTHSELVKLKGQYAKMLELQSGF